jgi:hypothetical protein
MLLQALLLNSKKGVNIMGKCGGKAPSAKALKAPKGGGCKGGKC